MFSKKKAQTLCAGLMTATVMAMPVAAEAASYGGASTGANNVPVTVNYTGSAAKAMIPKSIQFSGKSGEYTVMAYCETDQVDDLDSNISITPSPSFTLTKSEGGETISASVSQTKTTFTPSDIRSGKDSTIQMSTNGGTPENMAVKQAETTGTIRAADITAGTWTGTMVFTVS